MVKTMTENVAKEILLWKYEHPYNFYNNEVSNGAIKELLEGNYFAVVDETNQLAGFFCTGDSAKVFGGIPYGAYPNNMIDIGLGMKPELTGKGLGFSFLTFILQQIQQTNSNSLPLRLTVAAFNKRAIRLYENIGFSRKKSFISNGTEFSTMLLQNKTNGR
jgi:[ribosomal protein S18]-alanine N-acetyltransferase